MESSQRYYLCQYRGEFEKNAIVKAIAWKRGASIDMDQCLNLFVNTMNVDKDMSTINPLFEPETSLFVDSGVTIIQF